MSKQQQERTRLTVPQARELAEAVVRKMNYTPEESAIIAEHVIDAGLCGYEYSGLPKLLDAIESKRNLRPRTPMKIIKETPVSIVFDGGNNIGMLAIQRLGEAVQAKAMVSGRGIGLSFTEDEVLRWITANPRSPLSRRARSSPRRMPRRLWACVRCSATAAWPA